MAAHKVATGVFFLAMRIYTILQASSKGRRGLRGNSISVLPVPSAQIKFDFTAVPAKNAASTLP